MKGTPGEWALPSSYLVVFVAIVAGEKWRKGQNLCAAWEKSLPCRTLARVDKRSAGLAIVDLCCSEAYNLSR